MLGVLAGAPSSAYVLSRTVKMHGALYGEFSRGNLYEYLASLERAGVIASTRVAAARGPRSTKTVYELTPRGRKRFEAVLVEALADAQAEDSLIEVACVLLKQLPAERARGMLAKRIAALQTHEKRLPRLFGKPKPGSGAALALAHAQAKICAEITWTKATWRMFAIRYSGLRASRS